MYKYFSFTILLSTFLLAGCFSETEKNTQFPLHERISDLHYQGSDIVYVGHDNEKDQIYKNGKPEGEKYNNITYLRNWDGLRISPEKIFIQFNNNGKLSISHGGKLSEEFDDITNLTEDLDIPLFIGKINGKEYYLSGINIQGIGYDKILNIKRSNNKQHIIISVISNGEPGVIYDGKYMSGVMATNFQSDGNSLLYVKTQGSQEHNLIRDDKIIFTWSGAGVIGSLLGGENVNVLELGYLGGDGEGTGDDAFMQYIVNGIPHEKTILLDEVHIPFFGENLFVYAFKKDDRYFFNANNKIYGPYMSYPNLQIFGEQKRFIATGKIDEYTIDLIVDNEKIGVFGNIGDIGFSPDKKHYAFSLDGKITIDGVEKKQVYPGGEVGPLIDNSGNLFSFYGIKDGNYHIIFNDNIVHHFPVDNIMEFRSIKPVLNNKHYILYGSDTLTIDGKLIPGFHGTNPHGAIECGDSVLALENTRPPDELSQLLIWTPEQQFIIDNSYIPVFSKDCSKVAYITRDKERVGVNELLLD